MAKKKTEPTLTVVDVEVSKLREHPHNVKIGHNVKVIAESIKEHGWDQPIVANRKGEVIIGNGRLMAARKLGLEIVPVVYVDDDEKQAMRRMFIDNRSSDFSMYDVDEIQNFLPDFQGYENLCCINDIVPIDIVNTSEPTDSGSSSSNSSGGSDDDFSNFSETLVFEVSYNKGNDDADSVIETLQGMDGVVVRMI